MKHRGWDYLDHMVQTCEEPFECMQGVASHEKLEGDTVERRIMTSTDYKMPTH